jgi:hypothetical protein
MARRLRNSTTMCASRLAAGRCRTLTIHSRNIAASISVSRQSTSVMFGLPPGQERDRLIQTAVSNDAAAAIDRWLASPDLRSPK